MPSSCSQVAWPAEGRCTGLDPGDTSQTLRGREDLPNAGLAPAAPADAGLDDSQADPFAWLANESCSKGDGAGHGPDDTCMAARPADTPSCRKDEEVEVTKTSSTVHTPVRCLFDVLPDDILLVDFQNVTTFSSGGSSAEKG